MRAYSWRLASVIALLLMSCSESPDQPEDPQLERRIQLDRRLKASIQTHPLPPVRLVARIERGLQNDPCIGSMARWYRRYSYGLDHERGVVDPNIVWFTFHQAGAYQFRAGRSIQEPREDDSLDDRPYLVASGTYDVAADRLAVEMCGPNTNVAASVRPGSSIANMLSDQH